MPSEISINIKMDPYLIAYMESIYGKQPIVFDRKDRIAGFLPRLLRKPLIGEDQFKDYGKENLKIVLPYNEEKNVLYHNFMPEVSQRAFHQIIYRLFKAQYHDFMNDAERHKISMKEAVDTFIDIHQLDSCITDMLIKERQRFKDSIAQSRWREKKRRQLNRDFVLS
jgi:hypothetical protein